MLVHPTRERLIALGLAGMAKAFEEQRRSPDIAALSFDERNRCYQATSLSTAGVA